MKLKSKISFLSKLASLIFIIGIFMLFFTWYGVFVELVGLSLMVYISRYRRMTWWRVFSYSLIYASLFGFLLFRLHINKVNFIEPEWNLMPSAEKYYFDPLYSQRSMNFNFDSLMMNEDELKNLHLFTTDTEATPSEAPLR